MTDYATLHEDKTYPVNAPTHVSNDNEYTKASVGTPPAYEPQLSSKAVDVHVHNHPPAPHLIEHPPSASNKRLIIAGIIGLVALVLILVTVITVTVLVTGSNDEVPTTPMPATTPATEGNWLVWGAWSECSTTCGKGTQERLRECTASICHGMDSQIRPCFESVCPSPLDNFGVWSTWGPWDECDECQTGQDVPTHKRTRQCQKNANQEDCIGDAVNTRPCDILQCPSCNRPCPGGTVDMSTCTCICVGETGTGRVFTESGEPLNNVLISNVERRNRILATTSEYGIYTLNDICTDTELSFLRIGYISVTAKFVPPMPDVILSRIVPLHIHREPRGAARLQGGCLTLTCEALGTPEPQYYEWFKDGMLITKSSFIAQNTLGFEQMTADDSASYHCRASNDYSAVYSRAAVVQVRDTANGFCHSSPMPSIQSLPVGCTHNGDDEVDVGQCLDTQCSTDISMPCDAETTTKCGVTAYNVVEINCGTGSFSMPVATSCGCVASINRHYHLVGVVIAADDKVGVPFAAVYVNDTQVSTTSITGMFSLMGIIEGPRLSVKVEATNKYAEQLTVVELSEENIDAQYLVIKMSERLPELEFSSTDEINLTPGNQQFSTGFADITIAPNSLFNLDGSPFSGTAKISMEVVDTRDTESEIVAPGDFSSVDAEGEGTMLVSTGMFRIVAQDDQGNPLNIGGKVRVNFEGPLERSRKDGSILPISRTRLWTLDGSSANWQFLSNFQVANDTSRTTRRRRLKKRQLDWGDYSSELDGIDIRNRWTNFDYISENTCHSKVRFYEDNYFDPERMLTKAKVHVITLDPSTNHPRISGNSVSSVRAYSDNKDDSQGFCIVHPCDSPRSGSKHYDLRGYIVAEHERDPLQPDIDNVRFPSGLEYSTHENSIKVKFDLKQTPTGGPYYDWNRNKWTYSDMCSNADVNDVHFRFYRDDTTSGCGGNPYTRRHIPSDNKDPENLYSWRPNPEFSHYMFVKVLVDSTVSVLVRATSHVGRVTGSVPLTEGEVYGIREGCTDNKAVCLEVKVSGPITDGDKWYVNDALTAFNLSLVDATKTYSIQLNQALELLYLDDINVYGDVVNMVLQDYTLTYGSTFGIYHGHSLVEARDACRQGIDKEAYRYQTPDMLQDKWAFKFEEV